jgi:histidinol-phosphate aminotransferase
MEKKAVYIGRVWPVWPTYVRVTVGTLADMEAFMNAFAQVMDSPVHAAYATTAQGTSWRQDYPYPSLS